MRGVGIGLSARGGDLRREASRKNQKHLSGEVGMDNKIAPISLAIDASEAVSQVELISSLFDLKASSFENVPNHVIDLFLRHTRGLIDNISLRDFSTTISAENVDKICLKVKSSGLLNISLPQSGQTVFMVCMNISFLLLGRLKISRILAVGE